MRYMDFKIEKLEEYTTEQLQSFLDWIIDYWDKTNEVFSLTDLLEIERELTIRELQS